MKTLINSILFSLLFVVNIFSQNNDFGNMSYMEAIIVSEKQMGLSQQIAKAKMLQLAGMPETVYKEELDNTVALFEKNFKKLESNSKKLDFTVKAVIAEQSLTWSRYKQILEIPDLCVELLLKRSELLLEVCENTNEAINTDAIRKHQVTYIRRTDKIKAKANSLIENQKMLSQKLCLYYAASKSLGKKDEAGKITEKYLELYDELIGATSGLEKSELNTVDVYKTFANIKTTMDNLYKKRKNFIGTKVSLEKVIDTTESLESLLSEVTEFYSLL